MITLLKIIVFIRMIWRPKASDISRIGFRRRYISIINYDDGMEMVGHHYVAVHRDVSVM